MGTWARRCALACLLATTSGSACRTPTWIATDGGFRHARLGYWIARPDAAAAPAVGAAPSGAAPAWERVELAGAGLAFRRAGATLSFQRRCELPGASPAILARHLVIGIESREFVRAGPVSLGERQGWTQVYSIANEVGEPRLHFESVTLLDAGCAFDWLLLARGADREAIGAFEIWWRSFVFEPTAAESQRREDGN